jgi:hypothetical protein
MKKPAWAVRWGWSRLLQGSMMINIDTEEWGEFYMGCAGGVDVNVTREYASRHWLPAIRRSSCTSRA